MGAAFALGAGVFFDLAEAALAFGAAFALGAALAFFGLTNSSESLEVAFFVACATDEVDNSLKGATTDGLYAREVDSARLSVREICMDRSIL